MSRPAHQFDPNEDFKRFLRSETSLSRQIKLLGKNVLNLTQLVNARCPHDYSSPTDSDVSSFRVSELSNPSQPIDPISSISQGILALLVEGDHRKEWATLSSNLFHMGIAQAGVQGNPAAVAASGAGVLARFDLVFMPANLDPIVAKTIQIQIRESNYRAVFVAVTDGPSQEENLRIDWDQWYSEMISESATFDQVNRLVNRHYQPFDNSVL